MKNIRRTSDLVKSVLTEEPKARDCFDTLYYMVALKKNPAALGMTLAEVLLNRKKLDLPPFESVRRSWQKIRASHPELAGSDEVEAMRTLNEDIVKDYARGIV